MQPLRCARAGLRDGFRLRRLARIARRVLRRLEGLQKRFACCIIRRQNFDAVEDEHPALGTRESHRLADIRPLASAQAAAVRSSFLGMLALHLVARHANELWCTSTRLFRPVTLVELWMDTAVTTGSAKRSRVRPPQAASAPSREAALKRTARRQIYPATLTKDNPNLVSKTLINW